MRFDRIVSSPLKRALHTAEEFSKIFGGVKVEIDERIQEYDMGQASGMPMGGVSNVFKTTNPDAEDVNTFEMRVMNALQDQNVSNETSTLLVSHAGVARIIKWHYLDVRPETFIDLPSVPNAQVMAVEKLWG